MARAARSCSRSPAAHPAAEQSERLALGLLARQGAQEVEVAAFVGLQHVLQEERPVAAPVGRLARGALAEAAQRSRRPAGRGRCAARPRRGRSGRRRARRSAALRRPTSGATCSTTVPNAVPLIRASETRTMSLHTPGEQLLRNRHLSPFRHAGAASRPGIAQHEHGVGVDVEIRVVDARSDVVDVLEDERRAAVLEQGGRCGALLDDGAVRARGCRAGWRARPLPRSGSASVAITARSSVSAAAKPSCSVAPVTVSASPASSGASS